MGREGRMDCGRGIPIEGVWLVANAASNYSMRGGREQPLE